MQTSGLLLLILASLLLAPSTLFASATLSLISINGSNDSTVYVTGDTLTIAGLSTDPAAGTITVSVSDGTLTENGNGLPAEDGTFSIDVVASDLMEGPLTITLSDENGGSDSSMLAGIDVVKDTTAPAVSNVRIASNNTVRTASARTGDLVTVRFNADQELETVEVRINTVAVSVNTFSSAAPYAYFADYITPDSAAEGLVSFTLTYADEAGNEASAGATDDGSSVLIDRSGPVITLNGAASLEVEVGGSYSEQGTTATDASGVDGDVSVSGSVDVSTLGAYTLTYTALDVLGHTSTSTRLVTVIERVSNGGGGGRRAQTADEPEESAELEIAPASVAPDGEVLGAAVYNFTRYIKQGDFGEDVTELQTLLGALGYFAGTPTGYFGPVTTVALKAYQSSLGLEPVGFVGPKTLLFLNQGTMAEDVRQAPLIAEIERLKAAIELLRSVQ